MSCSAEIFSFDQTSGDNNVYYENEARKKVNEMGKESHVVINSMKKLKLIKAKPIVEATSWHKRANSCPTYYYVVCLEDTDTVIFLKVYIESAECNSCSLHKMKNRPRNLFARVPVNSPLLTHLPTFLTNTT